MIEDETTADGTIRQRSTYKQLVTLLCEITIFLQEGQVTTGSLIMKSSCFLAGKFK